MIFFRILNFDIKAIKFIHIRIKSDKPIKINMHTYRLLYNHRNYCYFDSTIIIII